MNPLSMVREASSAIDEEEEIRKSKSSNTLVFTSPEVPPSSSPQHSNPPPKPTSSFPNDLFTSTAPVSPSKTPSTPNFHKLHNQRKFRESTILNPDFLRPPYTLQEVIGEGSFGKVYKAKHKHMPEELQVAIKIIPITTNDMAELNKEIDFLRKIGKSNYIVSYLGNYQTMGGHLWIVMELCDMGSVNDVLTMCKFEFKEVEIVDIVACMCLGVSHLHSQRFIHRDIKAGNVLLTKRGGAKLADFGVSAQVSTLKAGRDTTIGTPYWMAPEVIQELEYNEKCDLWSLGITLIEIAEGAPPLSHLHPMRAVFMIPNRAPPTLQSSKWSKDMHDFLAQCLIKDAKLRAGAKELLLHPFIRNAVLKIESTELGTSENIAKLATECAPIIEQHLKRRSLAPITTASDEKEADKKLPPPPPLKKQRNNNNGAMKTSDLYVMTAVLLLAIFLAWWFVLPSVNRFFFPAPNRWWWPF